MGIEVLSVRIPLAGIRRERRIDFVSDLHLRSQADLDAFLFAAASLRSGTILMAGDYVEKPDLIEPLIDGLATLDAEIFAVFGNNDRAYKRNFFEFAGKTDRVRFLQDEVVNLDGIRLLGAHDRQEGQWLYWPLPGAPLVVLAHSPDALLAMPRGAKFTLLAGHVHGGQFRIPYWPWWWTHTSVGRAHGEGVSTRGENNVFVGRGIGYSMMKLRNVPSEIYEITFYGEDETAA